MQKIFLLENNQATENIAAKLAINVYAPMNIYLEGELGTGKTTFVKGFLRGLSFEASVKSPTYTLVELYAVKDYTILHADLYRIKEVSALEEMGFRDYFNEKTIALIEWASHAKNWLPKPDVLCALTFSANAKGRLLSITADQKIVEALC